ncbi:hypothetical protein MXB_1085 [Myxobolus squamalis]|nr:hypothetical protein MXB_1085 [Myxobolus squamalis]
MHARGSGLIMVTQTCVSNMSIENAPQSVYKVISLLLDSFNNIICHGFNNNPYIIFCTVLSSKVFYKVFMAINFKLDSLSSYSPKSNGHLNDDNTSLYELDKDALAQFSTKNIVRLLDILVPQVEKLCNEIVDFNEEYVAKFLKRSTIVGLINKPTQILTRRFELIKSEPAYNSCLHIRLILCQWMSRQILHR